LMKKQTSILEKCKFQILNQPQKRRFFPLFRILANHNKSF
jgi:hypothetical protein